MNEVLARGKVSDCSSAVVRQCGSVQLYGFESLSLCRPSFQEILHFLSVLNQVTYLYY